jgi:hypothetical protein
VTPRSGPDVAIPPPRAASLDAPTGPFYTEEAPGYATGRSNTPPGDGQSEDATGGPSCKGVCKGHPATIRVGLMTRYHRGLSWRSGGFSGSLIPPASMLPAVLRDPVPGASDE